MSILSRRHFLATASMAAAGTALGGRFAEAQTAVAPAPVAPAPVQIKTGVDTMILGKSGIKTSVLGMGTGTRSGREQRDLGVDGFVRLVREAYDRGIRYLDTADMYKTHPFVKAALKELPKGEMFVQTKIWSRDPKQAETDLDRVRKELGMETLDTLLIHCMTNDGWNVDLRPVMDVYLKAKEKGQIRALECVLPRFSGVRRRGRYAGDRCASRADQPVQGENGRHAREGLGSDRQDARR